MPAREMAGAVMSTGAAARDVAFAAVIAAGAGLLLLETGRLPARSALFPALVLWCLMALAAAIAASALWRLGSGTDARPADEAGAAWPRLAAAGLLVAGVSALPVAGFYLVAPLLIAGLRLVHGRRETGAWADLRAMARTVAFALAVTAVIWTLFDFLLGLPAPAGRLL